MFLQYGDSPSCLNRRRRNLTGLLATVQGYGKTEYGFASHNLLEATVKVIDSSECNNIMKYNATDNRNTMNTIIKSLPIGVQSGMICGQGSQNKDKVYQSSCAGDSGGPLYANLAYKKDKRKTLVGIVSGGYGCALGNPGWYTDVKFYSVWIRCIIDRSLIYGNNKKKVEKVCLPRDTKLGPTCFRKEDLIFGSEDTDLPEDALCKEQ